MLQIDVAQMTGIFVCLLALGALISFFLVRGAVKSALNQVLDQYFTRRELPPPEEKDYFAEYRTKKTEEFVVSETPENE